MAGKLKDVYEEKRVCEKCSKQQIIFHYKAVFGTSVADAVNEIRWRVEQITEGLTCSAGEL
jgi:hypothetical protein